MRGYLVNFSSSGVSNAFVKCIAEDKESAKVYISKSINEDDFRIIEIKEISFENIPIKELSTADLVRLIYATK